MIPNNSTPVKNEILIDIFAKGKLTRMEMRIASYIIRWSWGFDGKTRRQDWTKSMMEKQIAEDLGIHKVVACRTIKHMRRRKILLTEKLTKGLCYQFNEHYEDWEKLTEMLTKKKLTEMLTRVNRNVNKVTNGRSNKNSTQKANHKGIPSLAQKLRSKDLKETLKETVGFLNKKLNKNYRWQTSRTQKLIKGRLAEKYTLEDFKLVIEDRKMKWENDNKMKEYLRPSTLFAPTNFENYLNLAKDSVRDVDNLPDLMEG